MSITETVVSLMHPLSLSLSLSLSIQFNSIQMSFIGMTVK